MDFTVIFVPLLLLASPLARSIPISGAGNQSHTHTHTPFLAVLGFLRHTQTYINSYSRCKVCPLWKTLCPLGQCVVIKIKSAQRWRNISPLKKFVNLNFFPLLRVIDSNVCVCVCVCVRAECSYLCTLPFASLPSNRKKLTIAAAGTCAWRRGFCAKLRHEMVLFATQPRTGRQMIVIPRPFVLCSLPRC